MKIIATMAEAAEVIRICEQKRHASITSACRDCVLKEVCGGTGDLPNLFAITSKQLLFEDELLFVEGENDG